MKELIIVITAVVLMVVAGISIIDDWNRTTAEYYETLSRVEQKLENIKRLERALDNLEQKGR
jgi:uncharacterized protein YxeA